MKKWLGVNDENLSKEEKERKSLELKERNELNQCIHKYLIKKYNSKRIATLIEYNVRARVSQKTNTIKDFITSLMYLTPDEYRMIEQKVMDDLEKGQKKSLTIPTKVEVKQSENNNVFLPSF